MKIEIGIDEEVDIVVVDGELPSLYTYMVIRI